MFSSNDLIPDRFFYVLCRPRQISEEVFEEVLLSALQADLAAAFRTPEQLQLLLVALQRFPHTLKPKKLKKLLGSSTIINADNTPKYRHRRASFRHPPPSDTPRPPQVDRAVEDGCPVFQEGPRASGGGPGPPEALLKGRQLPALLEQHNRQRHVGGEAGSLLVSPGGQSRAVTRR